MPVLGRPLFVNVAIASAEYAVLTFFVLSGFLISLSVQKNIKNSQHFEWRAYLVQRVARIYPALIASVILGILLYWVLHCFGLTGVNSLIRVSDVYPASRTEFSLNWLEVVGTLMQTYAFGPGRYMSVNGPLWSLSYEVGFYLVTGLFLTMTNGKGIARVVSLPLLIACGSLAVHQGKWLFYTMEQFGCSVSACFSG